MSSESIGGLARRGLRLLAVRTAVSQVLSIVRMAVLARLLAPPEFGEFAFALALQAGLAVFTELGVRMLIIQRPTVEDGVLAAAWGLEFLRAFLLAGALVAMAPWIAATTGFPNMSVLLSLLAATLVVSAFDNPMSIMAERAVDLGPIATLETVHQLTELVLAVVLALAAPTSVSLASSFLFARLISVLLSYRAFPRPPRPRLDRAELRRLWHSGKYVLLVGVGTFVTAQADDLIVGGLLGPALLGAYYAAYRVAMLPIQLIAVGRRVLLPALARIQSEGDPERLRRAFARAARLQLALLIPCSLGLLAFADGIVQLALGSSWTSSITPLRLLSLACLSRGLCHAAMTLLSATGRFAFDARAKWLEVLVFVPSVFLGTLHLGPEGAAMGAGLSYSAGAVMRLVGVHAAAPGSVSWSRAVVVEALWCTPGLVTSGLAHALYEVGTIWAAGLFCAVWAGLTVTCRRELVAELRGIMGLPSPASSGQGAD